MGAGEMIGRRAGVGTALAALLAASAAPPASAAFTPPRLVSGDAALAADYAYDPAFAADGRFVAYAGSQAGVRGVYRKDLTSGALELVAGGDAAIPSISADGRRVAFTTRADLVPGDRSGACTSVYVRDMDVAPGAPDAYTLVSAQDGAETRLAYGDVATPGCPGGGATAARGALSADGRTIAFTVVGRSDLTGAAGVAETPPGQVAVRRIDDRSTQLVSQTSASLGGTPAPVPGGATLALPALGDTSGRPISTSSASVSADGTTVAWMGVQVPAQAATDPARFPGPVTDATPAWYAEPLWRRIADGPAAPTRRILGGDDDPDACAGCAGPLVASYAPNGASARQIDDVNPALGSFLFPVTLRSAPGPLRSWLDLVTPRLSADGRTVALLSTQPTPTEHEALRKIPSALEAQTANAFVVDMRPGLTRAQAVRRLTAWGSFEFGANNNARNAAVRDIALAPDGSRVAFATKRIVFPLSPPALVTAPLAQVVADELYQVDLTAGTLSLASSGYDGAPADGDVFGLSYAGDSRTLAFASAASNLVYGATNASTGVFAQSEVSVPVVPGAPLVTPPPRQPGPVARWRIGATASRLRDGRLAVDVTLPGAGSLALAASAAVRVAVPSPRAARGGPSRPGRGARPRTRVLRRTVARARTVAGSAGVVRLRMAAGRSYRALVRSRDGLDATLSIRFRASGRPSLAATLPVRFRATPRRPARRRAGARTGR